MICNKCNSNNLTEKIIRTVQQVKGEEISFITPAMVCNDCEAVLFTTKQMNSLRKKAADEYRLKYNLLTGDEIKEYRNKLSMSQSNFADYLNVGEASIKRWETYYVQDNVQDEHLKLKCNLADAEKNLTMVYWKNDVPSLFNGYKKFDFELFSNLLIKILELSNSPLYFFKILFYTDFKHYKDYGTSITGTKYAALPYGPVPDQYKVLINTLKEKKIIKEVTGHSLQPLVGFNLNTFDNKETNTINTVLEIVKKEGEKRLFDLSHEEDAYNKTDFAMLISYEHAKNLKI